MSFQKFMNKKDFHPGSFRNIKMAWEAEEKTRIEKAKEDDLRAQYDREQESYRNRQQMAGSGREKLQLNFMYDVPPGMRREDMDREDENPDVGPDGLPRLKLELKKPANNKSTSALGESDTVGEKRHIQCYRCSKWGHANTEKICPLYNVPREEEDNKFVHNVDSMKLIREMRHDGFAFNKSLYGGVINVAKQSQELIMSGDEEEDSLRADDIELVSSLTKKQKRKLLRRLELGAGGGEMDISQAVASIVAQDKVDDITKEKTKKHKKKKKKKTADGRDSDNEEAASNDSLRRELGKSGSRTDKKSDRLRERSPEESRQSRKRHRSASDSEERKQRQRRRSRSPLDKSSSRESRRRQESPVEDRLHSSRNDQSSHRDRDRPKRSSQSERAGDHGDDGRRSRKHESSRDDDRHRSRRDRDDGHDRRRHHGDHSDHRHHHRQQRRSESDGT